MFSIFLDYFISEWARKTSCLDIRDELIAIIEIHIEKLILKSWGIPAPDNKQIVNEIIKEYQSHLITRTEVKRKEYK